MALWTRRFAVWSRNLQKMNSPNLPENFLPPINRNMHELDRSFFRKTILLSAATIFEKRDIAKVRAELVRSGDILLVDGIKVMRDDETTPGQKCMLLKPAVDATDPSTWSTAIRKFVEEKIAALRPYPLTLTYEDWTMHNILEATLPVLPEHEKETPAGFTQIGHVAHLNLREKYLPHKHLIGQILLDKNPAVRTVINKTEDVGTESVFRTFPYEVLAGPDDMDVTISSNGCEFKFNFGKVYWNTRLEFEHERLISKFREGETVCDVMAGVGPFAVPSGKRNVFVWANDLNPDSYEGLSWAIKRNKVDQFVHASCSDGRAFIRSTTKGLPMTKRRAVLKPKMSRAVSQVETMQAVRILEEPASFDHYVMNLPASAVEFLDAFRGVYVGREREFQPHTERKLPTVHVYCFMRTMDTETEENNAVCELVSQHLGHPITYASPDVELWYVRLVSPKKKMFCASFRLPPEVAFAGHDNRAA